MHNRAVGKERDAAGTAAFEVALQYLLLRQDRSYHFVQLLTALFSLIFFSQLLVLTFSSLLFPLLPPTLPLYTVWLEDISSPLLTLLSLVALLLIRASKKRFIIEHGDQTIDRLNRVLLEPSLGMKFDVDAGKLYSDGRVCSSRDVEGFYGMHYRGGASSS